MVKIKPQGSAVGTSWILTRNFSVAAAFFLSFEEILDGYYSRDHP
jgi:hypothetical protein